MTTSNQAPPPFEIHHVLAQPFPERIRLICRSWLFQENATPIAVYFAYIFKIALLYVGGWCFFCSFTPGMGSPLAIGSWAMSSIAFQKAVLWSLCYESLGVGCSSGPMTGRIIPPIGGILFFLRPGTIKLPLIPGLPIVGGSQRTWLNVAMYAAIQLFVLRALTATAVTPAMLLPLLILYPIAALSDRTVFLCARGEHYYTALVCFWFMNVGGDAWVAGSKMIWLAIWFWAATSKLNHHFPTVICVMMTNNRFVPAWFHKKLYQEFPNDMRPSLLASTLAHFGTFTEYSIAFVFLFIGDGPLTAYALGLMVAFHCFIAGNFPMGMPVEWNVMMVYGGLFLFGTLAAVTVTAILTAPLLLAFLLVILLVIPLYGNLFPARVSFLMSMRYYAGNWAYSAWLFKKGAEQKLNALNTPVPLLREQMNRVIEDPDVVETAIAMQPSFRMIHLQGRALHPALPKAVDNIDDYEWSDGEIIAGMVVGWNFGDGHLHDEQLISSIQERCGFEEGELRVIIVESQPLGGSSHAWRIVDAAKGQLECGETKIADMLKWQPWPTGEHAEPYSRQS